MEIGLLVRSRPHLFADRDGYLSSELPQQYPQDLHSQDFS